MASGTGGQRLEANRPDEVFFQSLRATGFIGWLTWLVVHIYYLIGFRNRLAVLASWAWNYIRKDRSIRIIARSEADPLTEELETGRGTPPREIRAHGP